MEISQQRIFASADFRYCEISLRWMRNFAKMTEKFRLTWRKFASALTQFSGEISSNFCEIKERKTPNFVCISFAQYCTSIENYFFIVLLIIFGGIANLFLGLQCPAGLAVEVDWFESLTSLGDHFENFEVEECFQRECQGETLSGKETKEVFIFLSKSVRNQ